MDKYIEVPDLTKISSEGLKNIERLIPSFSFETMMEEITASKNIFNPGQILNTLCKIFLEEIYSSLRLLSVIMAIILLGAFLENLRASYESNNLKAGIVSVSLVIGLAVKVFKTISAYALNVSTDMCNVMSALLPIMLPLFVSSGFALTGSAMQPVLYFMCNLFAVAFTKVLIPISSAYLAISLADEMSEGVSLSKLRELIKKIYNFILGIIMTVFTGILGISSFVTVALDSVGAKGARFAISSMVPIVGGSVSDALGAVVSAAVVLKNTIGVGGIICVLALCIVPVLKIGIIVLFIRLTNAITEPVAEKHTITALSAVADSLSMVNAAVISTAIMMIISIGIIMGIKG